MSRRRIIAIFVATLCLPAVTILWLGARLLDQDRRLEAQYRQERREQAADRAVRSLQATLSDPVLFQTAPGNGAVLVVYPDGAALFRPEAETLLEAPAEVFREGEDLEYRKQDLERAAVFYRRLTGATEPSVRAGAWLRLARCLRKARRHSETLAAYGELSRIQNVAAAGWPASLAGAWGHCSVLEDLKRGNELRESAVSLRRSLDQGRWRLTRSTYEAFAEDAERWTGEKRPFLKEVLTGAANAVWEKVRKGEEPGEGCRSVAVGSEPVTLLWKPAQKGTAVFAASSSFVQRAWLPRTGEKIWLYDEARTPRPNDFVLRHPAETRLPWIVAVASPTTTSGFGTRRELLFVLLGMVALFTLTGGYFVLRAMRREFDLARMQSDFVSAVSHEFRTPLTSIHLITEALEDDRVPDEARRRSSYRSLSRATRRLHRLVEDLLDFRKMESGAIEYRMKPLDAGDLVRGVVEEFRQEVEGRGICVGDRLDRGVRIQADQSALSRALWNLLDNAAKYSGESRQIEVRLERNGSQASISVADRGIGIAREERDRLFSKFYRGAEAKRAGIHGTGIGLAMVAQIVAAHRGRVSVESEPGRGSTFTIWLPREDA